MKKLTAILLSLLMMFSFASLAFAQENETYTPHEYASTSAINNGKINLDYGGTFWYCTTNDTIYSESSFANKKNTDCPCAGCPEDGVTGHDSIEIYYALKCPECKYLNCAYNAVDFYKAYSDLSYTAPDGSKTNECSVCGYLFSQTDVKEEIVETEIVEEEQVTHTTVVRNCTVVYKGDASLLSKFGLDGDDIATMSAEEFESTQKSGKVMSYILLPFVKLYHICTMGPGLVLDFILYFVGDLVADLLA